MRLAVSRSRKVRRERNEIEREHRLAVQVVKFQGTGACDGRENMREKCFLPFIIFGKIMNFPTYLLSLKNTT